MKKSACFAVLLFVLLTSAATASEHPFTVHAVREGVTLQSVADAMGMSADDLASANGYAGTTNLVAPGTTLLVPKSPGDVLATLYEAKRRGLGGWPKPRYASEFLAPLVPEAFGSAISPSLTPAQEAPSPQQGATNRPSPETSLAEGEHPPSAAAIDGREGTDPPERARASGAEPPADPAPSTVGSMGTYRVQEGDTLYRIAKNHGVPLAALLEANDRTETSVIRVGETLTIPTEKGAEAPTSVAGTTPSSHGTPETSASSENTQPRGPSVTVRLVWPLRSDQSADSPVKGASSGVTIAAAEETSVLAAADGTVLHGGWMKSFGNAVFIRHNGGFTTFYGHLGILYVRAGQKVFAGDRIGLVGEGSPPRLAFHLLKDGHSVDPAPYMATSH